MWVYLSSHNIFSLSLAWKFICGTDVESNIEVSYLLEVTLWKIYCLSGNLFVSQPRLSGQSVLSPALSRRRWFKTCFSWSTWELDVKQFMPGKYLDHSRKSILNLFTPSCFHRGFDCKSLTVLPLAQCCSTAIYGTTLQGVEYLWGDGQFLFLKSTLGTALTVNLWSKCLF